MHLDELYLPVYENPSDDVARRVLADALLELGDVRGELIALQHATNALARKRAHKLIERHRAHFLGPLNGVVLHGTDVWDRGFLVGCTARLKGDLVACPAWATVQHLDVIGDYELDPNELGSRWMLSLREVRVRWVHDGRPWAHLYPEQGSVRSRAVRVLTEANRLRLLRS